MKLSLLFLATGSLAFSLDIRGPLLFSRQNGLSDSIQKITDAAKAADESVTSGSYTKLADNFKAIITALDDGTTAANNSPQLEQQAALGLAAPAQALSETTVKALQDISSKKSDIVAAGLGGAVYEALKEAQGKADAYIVAFTSKVPSSLSNIASSIVKPAQDQFTKTVNDFKDAAGSSTGGGAATSPSPASSATTPAATTPAANSTAPVSSKGSSTATSAPSAPAGAHGPPSSNTTTCTTSTTGAAATTASTGTKASAASTASTASTVTKASATANTTASATTTKPVAYTGAAVPVFAMGPAAIAAAALAAVAAL